MDKIMNWLNATSGQDDKLQHLRRKARALRAKAADVSAEVEQEENRPGKKRKREVDNWLKDVNKMEIQLQRFEQQVKSSSSATNEATKLTKEMGELIGQGSFPKGFTIYDHGSSSIELVTTDIKVNDHRFEVNKRKVMSWLTEDGAISVIGVYGPGGVGKTTLLKEIYNKLLPEHFKSSRHVYWVSVSHGITVSMLQDKVADAMGLCYLLQEKNEIRKAATLSHEMKKKKNVVWILDDVWEHFPVEEVGISVGESGCKLILTSRSLDVCRRMKSREIVKVEPLSQEEAWKLFTRRFGREIPSKLQDVAQRIAAECAGLPLAINVMAGSMRGVDDIQEWCNTLEELRISFEGQSDMEQDVFPVLKLSYDRLKDSKLRQCFLLCALYPKDSEINRDELITLFRSEGLLDGMQTWQKQFDKAHSMLNRLENVCLLERCNFRCVKMHNLIRDMAVRIAKVAPRFMIAAGAKLQRIPSGQRWTIDLNKVSLMQNSLSEIQPGTIPMCPCLSTLLLQRNPFTKLPDPFFQYMKGLKVLNLSYTSMKRLPTSVSELENLRALVLQSCTRLLSVPSLVKLSKLRELDFSFCWSMKKVPDGMEQLTNLRFLDLEGSKDLSQLLGRSLCTLSHIQCLKLDSDVQSIFGDDIGKLWHLERLEGCRIPDVTSFNKYVKTQHFQQLNYYEFVVGLGGYKRINYSEHNSDRTGQNISTCEDRTVVLCSRSFGGGVEGEYFVPPAHTRYLQIHNCDFSARSLVDALPSVHSLTALKKILIRRCRVIEYIWSPESRFEAIGERFLSHATATLPLLQCLKELILTDLQDFRGLVKEGVSLPRGAFSNLKVLIIKFCPKIKKLFISSLLQLWCLDNLLELEVEGCEELEEIIATTDDDDEVDGQVNVDSPITRLPKLRALQLRRLPQLTSIYHGGLLGNGSIEQITVEYCAKIKHIFTPNLPHHHLRNLREVKVVGCENLQEMIETSTSGSGSQESSFAELPNLRALVLDDLPYLTTIFPTKLLTCNSIEHISIQDCPKVRRLPLSIPIFSNEQKPSPPPCLQEIKANRDWWESLEWDNPHLKKLLQPFVKLGGEKECTFEIIEEPDSPGRHIKQADTDFGTGVNTIDISSCVTVERDEDGTTDSNVEAKYEDLTRLHAKQTEKHVEDEQPSVEREAILDKEIEELKASNNGLKAEIERMKVEALERENKLREEFMQMFSQLTLR